MSDPDVVGGRGFRSRVLAYRHGKEGPQPPSDVVRALKQYAKTLDITWHHSAAGDAFDSLGRRTRNGRWAIWQITRRYVPQGRFDGKQFYLSMQIPHLITLVTELAKPGEIAGAYRDLSMEVVPFIKRADFWHWKGRKMDAVDRSEEAEKTAYKKLDSKSEPVYREMWSTWRSMDTPHIYVPKSY